MHKVQLLWPFDSNISYTFVDIYCTDKSADSFCRLFKGLTLTGNLRKPRDDDDDDNDGIENVTKKV